jgi:hypothetical protein
VRNCACFSSTDYLVFFQIDELVHSEKGHQNPPSHIISGNVINASKPEVAMDNNGDNEEKVDSGVPSQSGQAHQSGRKQGNRLRKSMRSFAPVDATSLNSSNAASDSSGYRVRTDRVANRSGQ